MNPLQAAYWYFSVVFTIAFLLKPLQYLWLEPTMGAQGARWLEAIVMLVGTVVSARWVVLRLRKPATPKRRLSIGLIATAFIVLSEIVVEFWFRRLSFRDYLGERDLAATATYALCLLTFTVMPLLAGRE